MNDLDVWRTWARLVFFNNSAESAEWTNDQLRNKLTATWTAAQIQVEKCPRCGYQSPVASQEEIYRGQRG
jgi:hypothetical protein